MIIGLTGGSGCGTTSVGKILSAEGWGFIDCDAVYHKMLNTDAALKAELAGCFGEEILTQDGLVDRRALGKIVFASEKALADLNRITHARIAEKVITLISESDKLDIVIEAVELVDSGMDELCTAVIAVLAERETRLFRIMIRDAISKNDAERRIDAQRSDGYYREHCDYCIENNGTFDELKTKTLKIVEEIRHSRLNVSK